MSPSRATLRNLAGGRAARIALLGAGPAVAVAVGLYLYASSGRFVSTENAYVKSNKVAVSADMSGRVERVFVKENDRVAVGDVLFRIDPADFRIALARAEARLAGAVQDIEGLKAFYRQKQAELRLADDTVDFHRREYERRRALSGRGVVSQSRLEEGQFNVDSAIQRVSAIKQDIARVLANLGGKPDLADDVHPTYRAAMADRDRAGLDLARTKIVASVAGVVTRIDLQPGEYVRAGTPVFSIVADRGVWVEANLKETELTDVRVGQPATLRVAAYPGRVVKARVGGVSPATGAEFSLLPPQNAMGNWVKVVQRLPVRLEIVEADPDPPLRAGMSVAVEIDTGRGRALPSLFESALALLVGAGR